ncbi:hypothetical protein INS49_012492 [Diaporthe citri]|uniref:uncharacterized protein n=1 Tax=Diaporthe citri TaxID=83186 RepID=UPI001C7E38BF|nr:uncharacterized protein INS49_012492 [Diaporthe citri]KAG6358972.1 hypothetical protein INS49_012492 [Diaporthe citri]
MPARAPTEEEIAWMMEHKEDTLVPNILACNIICGVASIIVLVLRFWSRRVSYGRIRVETSDFLFIIAWFWYIGYLVCFSVTTRYGEGLHIIFVTDGRLLQIWSIATEVCYYLSMGFLKFSILKLYGSIFISRRFHYCLWAVHAFVAGLTISAAGVSIGQCTPIAYGWDQTIPGGSCVNYGLLVLIAGVLNVVTDLVILILPIPSVLRLQISKQKKHLIIFTFAMGSSACIVSIIRLAFSLMVGSTPDVSWTNVPSAFVTAAELLVGILATSIPTYRPLYRRFIQRFTSQKSSNQNYQPGSHENAGSHSVKVSAGATTPVDSDGIHFTSQIELTRHTHRNGVWVRVDDEDATGPHNVSGRPEGG